ncbi:ABC transporter permease [Luedemannella flava]|uniref:ABC transporter permease n=1 Tax=Luedemannella flava TaxID=349316 RepID=A0ABN2LDF4_9ACTN
MTVTAPTSVTTPMRRHRGFLRQALGLRRTRIGLVAVGLLVAVAMVGPFLAPYSATEFVDIPFLANSDVATLGTDNLGRDVLSRFLLGGRSILVIAFLGTVLGVGTGTALGLLAGYSTRFADEAVMRLADLLLAFPGIVLALLLITVSGPHDWVLVGVVGLGIMPYTARIVRSSTMQVRDSDYVRYAEGTGTPTRRILASEILPNIAAPLTVEFGLRLTQSIGAIAGLAYLGLGSGPPAADWGLMIQENQNGLTLAPMSVLLPIIAIAVLTVGANLVTDGIAQAAAGVNRAVEG